MSRQLAIDTAVLERAMQGKSPEQFGSAFSRAFYRIKQSGTGTLSSIDKTACALGLHPFQLAPDWFTDTTSPGGGLTCRLTISWPPSRSGSCPRAIRCAI